MSCGVKLPGPKTRTGPMSSGQDSNPEKFKEYVRLFEKFQQIRPDDSHGEIEKLIELVENGILKEEGNSFVVRGSEDSESDDPGITSFESELILSTGNRVHVTRQEFQTRNSMTGISVLPVFRAVPQLMQSSSSLQCRGNMYPRKSLLPFYRCNIH